MIYRNLLTWWRPFSVIPSNNMVSWNIKAKSYFPRKLSSPSEKILNKEIILKDEINGNNAGSFKTDMYFTT